MPAKKVRFAKGTKYTPRQKKVATVATVKRMISKSSETKTHTDTNLTALNGSTAIVKVLNEIAQGSGEGTRDGNKISVNKIRFSARCLVHASNTTGDIVRIMIVRDKMAVADTACTMADVCGTASLYALPRKDVISRKRYDILHDKLYNFSTTRDVGVIKITKYVKDKQVLFNGTGTGDYDKGNLVLLAIADDNTNKMTWAGESSIEYKDS